MKFLPLCFLCLILTGCQQFGSSSVSGNVFIQTKGAGAYKLGAVTVKFFNKKRIDEIKARGETPAYDFLTSDFQTISDADGKFLATLPKDQYYAFAKASRAVLDQTEQYEWLVPFDAAQSNSVLSLNNENVTK